MWNEEFHYRYRVDGQEATFPRSQYQEATRIIQEASGFLALAS